MCLGVSPGRVLGCREPRLRSLAVDSSAGADQLVPASRVSAWERVRPRPGLGRSSSVQPPPENSPCLVPGAPLAEGAAGADLFSLSPKSREQISVLRRRQEELGRRKRLRLFALATPGQGLVSSRAVATPG